MKKKLLILLFFLIILPISLAQDDLILKEELDSELEISSSVDIIRTSTSGRLEYVNLDLNYLPQDSFRQRVITLLTSPKADIAEDIHYEWKNPKIFPLEFSMTSRIKTYPDFFKITKKVNFPLSEVPIDVYKYTKPTSMIDFNDDIKALAAQLAEGEDDLYHVVFNLAVWTNQNIKYDLQSVAADAALPSSWVLEKRYGVCDELTNLFISMARSLGIPSRFITGMSFTNSPEFKSEWGLHGWAEVYFPGFGWVPFDPTYGQLGFVDAGHIKLKDSLDSNRSSTEYEWLGRNIELMPKALDMNVNVLNTGRNLPPITELSVQAFERKVGFGSYNFIEAAVENKNDYYLTNNLYLSVPKEIIMLDDSEKMVILEPNSKKSVFWRIKVPQTLKKNLIYTFPAAVSTARNYTVKTDFESVFDGDMISLQMIDSIIEDEKNGWQQANNEGLLFLCSPDKSEVDVGEQFIVACNIKNEMDHKISTLKVCAINKCETITINAKGEQEVVFQGSFDEIGGKFIAAKATGKDISKSSYLNFLVLDTPKVNITHLNYPKIAGFSDEIIVNFTLERISIAVPIDVEVIFYHNKNSQNFKTERLEGSVPFSIGLEGSMLKFNDNDIRILVIFKDKNGNEFKTEESLIITLDILTFFEKIQVILNQFYLWMERQL